VSDTTLSVGIQGLPPAPCPWCGAPSEYVKVHSLQTSDDGKTAVFDIECAVCLVREKAQMMRREPDWMEVARHGR